MGPELNHVHSCVFSIKDPIDTDLTKLGIKDAFEPSEFYVCMICLTRLNTNSSTNVNKHFENTHPDVYAVHDKIVAPPFRPNSSQSTVDSYFSTDQTLTRKVVSWVCSSGRPFIIVEDEGLKECFDVVKKNSSRHLPSVRTLKRTHTIMAQEVRVKVKSEIAIHLENGGLVNVSCDGWSAPIVSDHPSYFVVFCHFMDAEDNYQSRLLWVYPAIGKTGEDARMEMREVLSRYEIPEDKVYSFVTDSGSDVKCAFSSEETKGEEEPFPNSYWGFCISHTLNLAIGDIFKPLWENKHAYIILRQAVNHLRHSNSLLKFQNLQRGIDDGDLVIEEDDAIDVEDGLVQSNFDSAGKSLNGKIYHIIGDNATRWNSKMKVVERFLFLKNVITTFYQTERTPSGLSDEIWGELSAVNQVFQILSITTSALQGESNDYGVGFVMIRNLVSDMYDLSQNSESERAKGLAYQMYLKLMQRFCECDQFDMMLKAVLVNPIYKRNFTKLISKMKLGDINQVNVVASRIKQGLKDDYEKYFHEEGKDNKVQEHVTKRRVNIAEVSDDEEEDTEDSFEDELTDFIDSRVEKKSSPQDYWRRKKSSFPKIYKLSQTLRSIPATVDEVERENSQLGLEFTPRRNRLGKRTLDDSRIIANDYKKNKKQRKN